MPHLRDQGPGHSAPHQGRSWSTSAAKTARTSTKRSPAPDPERPMAGLIDHSFFYPQVRVPLLLFCCLSPLSGTPTRKAETFATLVAALPGEPRLVIWKSQYTLTLYKGMVPVKTYPAVFGRGYSDGDKRKTGDKRTPEGDFYICTMNPQQAFLQVHGAQLSGPEACRVRASGAPDLPGLNTTRSKRPLTSGSRRPGAPGLAAPSASMAGPQLPGPDRPARV